MEADDRSAFGAKWRRFLETIADTKVIGVLEDSGLNAMKRAAPRPGDPIPVPFRRIFLGQVFDCRWPAIRIRSDANAWRVQKCLRSFP